MTVLKDDNVIKKVSFAGYYFDIFWKVLCNSYKIS